MKTITKTYEVYTLKELPDEAFRKAIDDNRTINVGNDNWWEHTIEEATETLEKMGFENAKIYFSGFYSQGDGASFEATVNVGKFDKKLAKKGVTAKITKSGRYDHEMTMGIETSFEDDEDVDKFEEKVLEIARKQARIIYKNLEQYYGDLTSEDAVADTMEVNEYQFLEDGSIFTK